MLKLRGLLAFLWFSHASSSFAVSIGVGAIGGLMQQPTSHYYHAMQGIHFDLASDSDKFIGRVSYLERPEFRNLGFSDKDYASLVLLGTKLTKTKNHGLYAFFGGGRISGYIKKDASEISAPKTVRSFRMDGPVASIEYMVELSKVALAISHQTFAGYIDRYQSEAFVLWPYNFLQLSFGYRW